MFGIFFHRGEKDSPDLPELITPPVSSQADDDDDFVSSSTVSALLLRIDSSDVHRLFEEPFLLFRSAFNSFTGLVCVDIVLHVPFVMGISSKSSSIFSTGKLLLSPDVAKSNCLEYFSKMSTAYFRLLLDDSAYNGRSFGRSTLNDCSGI